MRMLTFAILLRRMSALPKVLMIIARLGGHVTYVAASDGRANVVVNAPLAITHRFAPQLRRIVDVLELTELRVAGAPGVAPRDEDESARRRA